MFIYKYGQMHFLSTGIRSERETHPFAITEQCSRKMQEASSLDHSSLNPQSSVNKISSAEVKEVSQGHWNNYGSSNYGKKPWNKQDNYKGKKDLDKKPWYNKDKKSWNKDNRQQNNKESKPKDACITVTKDVKCFCPTGYDKGIFNAKIHWRI